MVTETGYSVGIMHLVTPYLTESKAFRWTFYSVAIVTTLGRFYLRWHYFKRVRWDDLFNGLAAVCLIAYFSTLVAGLSPSASSALFWQLSLAVYMLLWSTLYLVKASFLALYWPIFQVLPKFHTAWCLVSVYTALTFFPIFLSQLWECGAPSAYADPRTCLTFVENGQARFVTAQAAFVTALHASSDILILVLPLFFISRLQISRVQKFSLAAVFAIVIIDIVMGILRNIAVMCFYLGYSTENSYAIATTMGTCEPSVAVIVCALPAYRVLLTKSSRERGSRSRRSDREWLKGEGGKRKVPEPSLDSDKLTRMSESTVAGPTAMEVEKGNMF